MKITDEAVEAAARHLAMKSDEDWSGDQWTNEKIDDLFRAVWREQARELLEAAAPYMLAGDRAEVWAEGHEDGFWNGRMSSGDTSDMALIGKEHANATNPYRPTP